MPMLLPTYLAILSDHPSDPRNASSCDQRLLGQLGGIWCMVNGSLDGNGAWVMDGYTGYARLSLRPYSRDPRDSLLGLAKVSTSAQ